MKNFTKGFAAGVSALAISVPVFAQMTFAASGDSASSVTGTKTKVVPSQACVQAMANLETAHLGNVDAMIAQQKKNIQARRDALVAAAAITDDTKRQEALNAAHASMKDDVKPAIPETVSKAMEAVKTACGNTMFLKGGMHGGKMEGRPFMKKMMKREAKAGTTSSASSI